MKIPRKSSHIYGNLCYKLVKSASETLSLETPNNRVTFCNYCKAEKYDRTKQESYHGAHKAHKYLNLSNFSKLESKLFHYSRNFLHRLLRCYQGVVLHDPDGKIFLRQTFAIVIVRYL